jgi:hypothetical protein
MGDMHPRFVSAATLAVFALAGLPAVAAADGLPAVGVDAHPLGLPDGQVVFVTKRAGHDTRLIQRARYGGPMRERRIRARFSVPAVAYDGSPSGLSADGRKVVLISPRTRFPRRRTTFAVVDAHSLTVRRHISLRGDFSFDAISPNGRTMYLIQYNRRNFTDYAVRGYDMRAGRLLAKPIVDPHEADEPMTGMPVTRVPSRDGRWQYTLYDQGGASFVHALDTRDRTAACIDLDGVATVWNTTLSLHGSRLDVIGKGAHVMARIDTRTNKVIEPKADPERAAGHAGDRARAREDASTSWLPLAAIPALLLLLGAAARRRMLKQTAAEPITDTWEPPSDRHAPTA